jgi:hypothetical protein
MARELRRIPFEELERDPAGVFDRIQRERASVVVEREGSPIAVVKPVPAAKGPRPRRAKTADIEAFLSSAGGWRGLVDVDRFKEDNAASRRLSSRPPVEL